MNKIEILSVNSGTNITLSRLMYKMIWKVTWNPKLYDYQKLIQDYQNNQHSGYLKQSKGMANMKNVPQIGDIIYVSSNKLKIIKCELVSDFITNKDQINDPYSKGIIIIREHTKNNTFIEMKIIEIYMNPEQLLGSQRTWIKFS